MMVAPLSLGETKSPDFSEGLEQLAGLGLPAMEGAEWVKFSGETQQVFTSSYGFRELGVNLTGSAWKLATDPPTYIDFGSSQAIASPDSEEQDTATEGKPGLLGKMLRNYKGKNPEPEKPAEPASAISRAAKDAERIVASLGKATVREEINNNIEWGNSDLHGRLMLFAAQLHAAGETDAANRLATALFNAVNEDSALIDGAVSHLADNLYTESANEFFKGTDWEKYHSGVTALLEKFPRGWADAPAVALLVSKLENRSGTPPVPSLPGIELKPEAVEQLGKLLERQEAVTDVEALAAAQGINVNDYPAEMRPQIIAMLRERGMGGSYSGQGIWLLPSQGDDETADTSPAGKLKAMGMEGFIALAAVATDETLVPIRHSSDGSSYYSSNESPAAVIMRRYANLNRPTSRGEIAVSLLSSVLPSQSNDDYGDSSEADPAVLAETAIEFWKNNREKSPVELATLYIAEGNTSQQSYASSFLATSTDPAAHAAFEKTVLASDDPLALITNVDGYVGTRKEAAKEFAAAYIKLLRENPPDEEQLQQTAGGYQIREAGGLENYIKKLSLKVGDVSLEKMIAEALRKNPVEEPVKKDPFDEYSGDRAKKSPVQELASTIQSVPVNECLVALGNAAGIASAEQWMEIHQLLRTRIYYELRNSDGEESIGFEPLPENVLEIWSPLIARTDPLPPGCDFSLYAGSYGAKTTGDASAIILELATAPGLTYAFNDFVQLEGSADSVMKFVRKRVTAWSSGEDPEPWPDVENVSEERTAEISRKLESLKAAEIIPYAQSLSRDERLTIMGILAEYGDSNPAPPGILELRQTVVRLKPIFDQDHDSEAAAKLGISVGDPITPELLAKVSDILLSDPASNNMTMVMFFPAPLNLGSNLFAVTAKDYDKAKTSRYGLKYYADRFDADDESPAICFFGINSETDIRTMKDGKSITREAENSALDSFAKALEAKSATLPYIRIALLTKEDVEKISNQE